MIRRRMQVYCEELKAKRDVLECIDNYVEANAFPKDRIPKSPSCRDCPQGARNRQDWASEETIIHVNLAIHNNKKGH